MRSLAIVALVLTACSPGTEVLVSVHATDLTVPADLQSIRISVTNPTATDPTHVVYDSGSIPLCGTGVTGACSPLPVTVDFIPRGSDLGTSVRVEVDAFATGTTPVISDASVFEFVRGQSQRLDFDLVHACLGATCAAQDQTCDDTGACAYLSPSGGSRPILAFDRPAFDYGAAVGSTTTQVFTLKNDGTKTSGPVAVSLTGDDAFAITANDCQGIPLGPPCTVSVTLDSTVLGSKSAMLVATANPGGTSRVALTNTAGTGPALTTTASSFDFGQGGIGATDQPTYAWTITNTGSASTGPLTQTISGANPSDFTTSNGCPTQLAGGASCVLTIMFAPTTDGARAAVVTLAAPSTAEGGSVSLAVTGTGAASLTLDFTGTGAGTVTILPDNVQCTSTCTHFYPTGTQLTLQARTTNGSNAYFQGWQTGACTGSFHDCALTMTTSQTASPTFAPITSNLVFVSSATYASNLGGFAPYDAACNTLATSAGINDLAGSAYVAWMSGGPTDLDATTRVGSAEGFTRLDGAPVADTKASLLGASEIFNPISVTEDGTRLLADAQVWTGTRVTGDEAGASCTSWTVNTGNAQVGSVFGGPHEWTTLPSFASCASTLRIYCFMTTQIATVTPPPPTGKLIWWSTGFMSGGGIDAAHAFCDGKKPASIAGSMVKALLSTSTVVASTYLQQAATYVRPDGTVVGSGADLAEGDGRLLAGPWQNEIGAYGLLSPAFTGAPSPTALAPSMSASCEDWTSTSSIENPVAGDVDDVATWWSGYIGSVNCAAPATVYCVEQ